MAESTIRELAAANSLDGMLTDRRDEIVTECLGRLRERLGAYDLGIEIVELVVLDIHPPRDVVPAYRDVADAQEEQEQLRNEAEAYAAGRLIGAVGQSALETLAESRLPADDAPRSGRFATMQIDDRAWRQLSGNGAEGGILSGEAGAVLLQARRDATSTKAGAAGAAHRFERLLEAYQSDPALTGAELYWRRVEETLAERPLTILDPKSTGRRHLWLDRPERFSNLMPVLPETPVSEPGEEDEHAREERDAVGRHEASETPVSRPLAEPPIPNRPRE